MITLRCLLYKRVPDRNMRIPRGYRIGWREFDMRASICFPIGLHFLLRWCNWIWRWSYAYRGDRWEQALWDAKDRGCEQGRREERAYLDRMMRIVRDEVPPKSTVFIDEHGDREK